MKEIVYKPKGFTDSGNEYVTLTPEDMTYLMNQIIMTMSAYSELTATSQGGSIVLQSNAELFGKRGKATIAPYRPNTRLSTLGGIVYNYFRKQEEFRNDISLKQLPFIANILNECCDQLKFEPLVFRSDLFRWGTND